MMPEFYGKMGVNLICTSMEPMTELMAQASLLSDGVQPPRVDEDKMDHKVEKMAAAVRSLWGSGGSLSTLGLATAARSDKRACEEGGLLRTQLLNTAERLAAVLVPPPKAKPDAPSGPAELIEALRAVDGLDLNKVKKHDKNYKDSFVHENGCDFWRAEGACDAFVGFIMAMQGYAAQPPAWLKEWRPLVTHQHGDLNLKNILVDVTDNLWIIDFAKSGVMGPYEDAAFFVSRLLFQHYPIPPTVRTALPHPALAL